MTFGFSRDDAGKFLDAYYENKIYENDPFARLDQNGVGKLIKMAAEAAARPAPTSSWHLRRAWRRPDLRRVLPQYRPQLCILLSVPRADRPAGRCAGCY